jgi:hypothetical protein
MEARATVNADIVRLSALTSNSFELSSADDVKTFTIREKVRVSALENTGRLGRLSMQGIPFECGSPL